MCLSMSETSLRSLVTTPVASELRGLLTVSSTAPLCSPTLYLRGGLDEMDHIVRYGPATRRCPRLTRQGLTLVHFSAQPELVLTPNHPLNA